VNNIILTITDENKNRRTPLLKAINKNNKDMVKLIIDYSIKTNEIPKVNEKDIKKPLHLDKEIIYILNKCNKEKTIDITFMEESKILILEEEETPIKEVSKDINEILKTEEKEEKPTEETPKEENEILIQENKKILIEDIPKEENEILEIKEEDKPTEDTHKDENEIVKQEADDKPTEDTPKEESEILKQEDNEMPIEATP
jgi:ankyrin repeat protein